MRGMLTVPHPNGAVLAVADDQLALGVEDDAGDIVGVPCHRVHLPRLSLVHAPQLHLKGMQSVVENHRRNAYVGESRGWKTHKRDV